MTICSVHKVESAWKTGTSKKTGKPYAFWACPVKENDTYCKAEQIESNAPKEEVREPLVEPKVDWDAKDRQSMAQTAMKSASEIVAAMIAVGDKEAQTIPLESVRSMANEFYKELLKLKSDPTSVSKTTDSSIE